MHLAKWWPPVLVLICFAVVPVHAGKLVYHVCDDDVLIVQPPRIDLGCEIIDCCPGCPGSPPLDLAIRVEGDLVRGAVFEVRGGDARLFAKNPIRGDGEWVDRNKLRVSKGEIRIDKFVDRTPDRPMALVPRFEVDEHLLKQQAGREPNLKLKPIEIVIEQFLAQTRVAQHKLIYNLHPCPGECGFTRPGLVSDIVDLDNNDGNDRSVTLLDCRRQNACIDNLTCLTRDIAYPGNLLSSAGCPNSDIVTFSRDDAMKLIEGGMAWTSGGNDHLKVDLTPNRLEPKINIWVPSPQVKLLAEMHIRDADSLYNDSRTGVGFKSNVTYTVDQMKMGRAKAIWSNYCTSGWRASLRTNGIYSPGEINVYYIDNPYTGLSCRDDRNIIVIAALAKDDTLAHELGHSFSLKHTNSQDGFGQNNIMWGGGSSREGFTLGQAFRSNVNSASSLNTNSERVGVVYDCWHDVVSWQCPAVEFHVP